MTEILKNMIAAIGIDIAARRGAVRDRALTAARQPRSGGSFS
jgi:hypothetical protein